MENVEFHKIRRFSNLFPRVICGSSYGILRFMFRSRSLKKGLEQNR
ncbi:hypothetical protein LEP1GSC050_2879 [Leptospira broomii serovar Hurstbridge str. 5399]|uniref:Uncharacterized protein n=1 Tax=Leptospira broomii serovar Hurstbridge str. 5399 TaxID=1049789 RepID=T0F080_9LEPT|nr:hypothetical protein LEP1GSC050_2879 [Leptospira broomii serovar Hurstbridge str. 5399]